MQSKFVWIKSLLDLRPLQNLALSSVCQIEIEISNDIYTDPFFIIITIKKIKANNEIYQIKFHLCYTILHPPHRDLDEVVNMKKFLDIVLYRNKGSAVQIGVVADLIKPFFRDVEQFILNEKLIKKIGKTLNVKGNLPQYVSWYKMWNK